MIMMVSPSATPGKFTAVPAEMVNTGAVGVVVLMSVIIPVASFLNITTSLKRGKNLFPESKSLGSRVIRIGAPGAGADTAANTMERSPFVVLFIVSESILGRVSGKAHVFDHTQETRALVTVLSVQFVADFRFVDVKG